MDKRERKLLDYNRCKRTLDIIKSKDAIKEDKLGKVRTSACNLVTVNHSWYVLKQSNGKTATNSTNAQTEHRDLRT